MGPLEIKGLIHIAAIVVGGLSIWIGYRLYVHGVLEKGRATAEGAGFKVTLASYGPGVVFALFGAFIVIFSLTRGMSSEKRETWTDANGHIREAYVYAEAAADASASSEDEAAADAAAAAGEATPETTPLPEPRTQTPH